MIRGFRSLFASLLLLALAPLAVPAHAQTAKTS